MDFRCEKIRERMEILWKMANHVHKGSYVSEKQTSSIIVEKSHLNISIGFKSIYYTIEPNKYIMHWHCNHFSECHAIEITAPPQWHVMQLGTYLIYGPNGFQKPVKKISCIYKLIPTTTQNDCLLKYAAKQTIHQIFRSEVEASGEITRTNSCLWKERPLFSHFLKVPVHQTVVEANDEQCWSTARARSSCDKPWTRADLQKTS